MKVLDLNGNQYTLQLSSNPINRAKLRDNRSEPHLNARQLLSETFAAYQIIEEVPIQVYRGTTLFLDFFIPLKRIAVEVHGEQHYTFNKHFHGNMANFFKQKKNDRAKEEWCEVNDIQLVVFKWNEFNEWKGQIQ